MNIFPVFFAAAKIGIGRGSFYFATTKIGIGRGAFYFAATKIGIGRVIVATTSFRRRAVLLAGTIALQRFLILGLDLRIDAAIRSKTGAIRASILDFKPRLANRCSHKVKTEVIPPAQGRTALCRGRGMPDGQGLRTA